MRRGAACRRCCASRTTSRRTPPSPAPSSIHGGLRYLEYYEFGLVRKALQEREVLLARGAAPDLAAALRAAARCASAPCLDDPRGPVPLRPPGPAQAAARIARRSTCAATRPARRWNRATARASCIRTAGWTTPGSWCSTRWTRTSAAPTCCTRTACVALQRDGDAWIAHAAQQRDRRERTLRARLVVNAAGPWVAAVPRRVHAARPRAITRAWSGQPHRGAAGCSTTSSPTSSRPPTGASSSPCRTRATSR